MVTAARTTSAVTAYAEAVVAGEVVTGRLVRLACQRHLDDLQHGHERGLWFDEDAAAWVIAFYGQMAHIKGEWASDPTKGIELAPWQAFIVGSLFGWKRADGARRFRTSYVEVARKNGKALALDTPIPTPDGWTTMGALQPGDTVFDEVGMPCSVVAVTEPMVDRPVYEVEFSDGERIIADAEHEWLTKARRKGNGTRGKRRTLQDDIRTTRQIAETLIASMGIKHGFPFVEWNHAIPVAEPLQTSPVDLPVPPYVLGAWLGDGHSAAALLTCSHEDSEILQHIEAAGVTVDERLSTRGAGCSSYALGNMGRTWAARTQSLQARLRTLGVLKNKHIPPIYLRASIAQRMTLLQGLMDTDGYVSRAGQCEFVSTSTRLAADVMELLRSLGFKPSMKEARARLYGKDCGPSYRIQFWAYDDRPVFGLTRKRNRQKPAPKTSTRASTRQIVACRPVESTPVRCIQVDSPSRLFLAGRSMIPTHNSTLMAPLGLLLAFFDGEPGAEVYSAATTRDQAKIVWNDAKAMVLKRPVLKKRVQALAHSLHSTATNSLFRPLAAEADNLDGLNIHGAIVDELHAHPNRKVVDVLETATGARRQPLISYITTAGFDRNSVCWAHHDYSQRVLEGQVDDDTWFAYVANLDGPRVESVQVLPGLKHLDKICTCGTVSTIPTDQLSRKACVTLATSHSTGPRVLTDALITRIDQSVLADSVDRAITESSWQRTPNTQTASGQQPENAPGKTPREHERGWQPIVSDGARPISSPATDAESMGFRRRSTRSYIDGLGDAVRSAGGSQNRYAWTTAMIQALSADSSVDSAMWHSVCSGILKTISEAHLPTCSVQKAKATTDGLIEVHLPEDDWRDPANWVKANPNLGVSVKLDDLERKAARAAQVPSEQQEFRRKHCSEWTESSTRWLDLDRWDANDATVDPDELEGRICYGGLDLSSTTDLTALSLLFPDDAGGYDVLTFPFLPDEALSKRSERDRAPYTEWRDAGYLTTTDGNVVDYDFVETLIEELAKKYDLRELAIDRWNSTGTQTRLMNKGITVVPFGQGFGSMTAPAKELERLVLEGKLRHGGHPVLRWAASNVVIQSDAAGNIKPAKHKSTGRIDPIVALTMAVGRAMVHVDEQPEVSVYESRGFLEFG